MYDIVCSIVCYKSEAVQLKKAIDSFLNTALNVKLILVDNSPSNELKNLSTDHRLEYIYNPTNPGFGAAHNLSIDKYLHETDYFLVLNPDIYFEPNVLEELYTYMESNKNIGNIMPKVLYPDGEIQYLAKLLPTPLDLIFRRFIPFKSLTKSRNDFFELRFSDYNSIMEVPFLSGCFMFLRASVLIEIGRFDDNIFMYGEDLDLSRRINEKYKTIFYPNVSIYHEHGKASYKSIKMLFIHIKSLIYYFNKWGWLFDKKRTKTNSRVIGQILNKNSSTVSL
jgi:GT2 family glycosyltransferase